MNKNSQNNAKPKNTFELTHIKFDSDDRNSDTIIIEVGEVDNTDNRSSLNSNNLENDSRSPEVLDTPDLISVGEYQLDENNTESIETTETSALCETLYESEASNEFSNVELNLNNDDGSHFLALAQTPPSDDDIGDDIPNEALIYTCQPESTEVLHMYPCKTCEIIVGCVFCLKSHYESVHLNLGLIQYKCNQTTYLRNYTEICHKCNLVCESKDEMVEHRKIHFVSCDVCDMSFDSALFLSNHCRTAHDKYEVIISCDLCEQWFKQLQDLSDHYEEFHEMILCIVCFKRFSNRAELREHHQTHKIVLTDTKPILPYACSKCNQAFAEISELSFHLVKYHPTRKATYGSIARKKVCVEKTKKPKFDDCGGLSQGKVFVVKVEGVGTKKYTKKDLKVNNSNN